MRKNSPAKELAERSKELAARSVRFMWLSRRSQDPDVRRQERLSAERLYRQAVSLFTQAMPGQTHVDGTSKVGDKLSRLASDLVYRRDRSLYVSFKMSAQGVSAFTRAFTQAGDRDGFILLAEDSFGRRHFLQDGEKWDISLVDLEDNPAFVDHKEDKMYFNGYFVLESDPGKWNKGDGFSFASGTSGFEVRFIANQDAWKVIVPEKGCSFYANVLREIATWEGVPAETRLELLRCENRNPSGYAVAMWRETKQKLGHSIHSS